MQLRKNREMKRPANEDIEMCLAIYTKFLGALGGYI